MITVIAVGMLKGGLYYVARQVMYHDISTVPAMSRVEYPSLMTFSLLVLVPGDRDCHTRVDLVYLSRLIV